MTHWLIVLAFGPVQDFIAAARRSQDLWCGSWLVSEMAKAAARYLRQAGADLIFPAPENDGDLEPGSEFNVANKIQALIPAGLNPAKLAAAAQQAARDRFNALAEAAREGLAVRAEVWDRQVGDYVESFAAWVPWAEGQSDYGQAVSQANGPDRRGAEPVRQSGYGQAVSQANRLLAARKATRDFRPGARTAGEAPGYGLPKSSLDGRRETVLPAGLGLSLKRRLALSPGEQLDRAGLVKRLAGRPEQFTPFPRLAAQPWLAGLPEEVLESPRRAYEPLVGLGLATRVAGRAGLYQAFPYDGELLYPFRLEAARRKAEKEGAEAAEQNDKDRAEVSLEALAQLRRAAAPVWKKFGEPCPYAAVLLADGDHMGALLEKAPSPEAHREISQALSRFARAVPDIIRSYAGRAVYAGGDDVLAFLPLPQALEAAEALRRSFAEALRQTCEQHFQDIPAAQQPTLSVGLALGHLGEPLGALRRLAKEAEKLAKGDDEPESRRRNALGLILRIRSGGSIKLRRRWDDEKWLPAFRKWAAAYESKQIPGRLAYGLRQSWERLRKFTAAGGQKVDFGQVKAELSLFLDRARAADGKKLTEETRLALEERLADLLNPSDSPDQPAIPERPAAPDSPAALEALADELLVARWLTARGARDLGEKA